MSNRLPDPSAAELARLRAEAARLRDERDAAICRQIYPGVDERWHVADGVGVEDGERLGPFPGAADAFRSVLAWVRFALDPEGVARPEYRTADGEEGDA